MARGTALSPPRRIDEEQRSPKRHLYGHATFSATGGLPDAINGEEVFPLLTTHPPFPASMWKASDRVMTGGRWRAFAAFYALAVISGETAAYLARLHRSLLSSDRARPPTAWLATAFVFGAWVPARVLFLIFARGCEAVAR